MKNSTIFFIVGYLFALGFIGIILFPGKTINQVINSIFIADLMGLVGILCMFFSKQEHALGR